MIMTMSMSMIIMKNDYINDEKDKSKNRILVGLY